MRRIIKYSQELKRQIRSDYKAGVFGYKRLAKKYGLSRDAVRAIIISEKEKIQRMMLIAREDQSYFFDDLEDEDIDLEKVIAYYKAENGLSKKNE